MTRMLLLFFGLMLAAPAAHAQLGGVSVPDVGGVVAGATDRAGDVADRTANSVRRLSDDRVGRVRDLLRRHRDELEADPAGEPIVRSQILALAPSPAGARSSARAKASKSCKPTT